MEEKQSGVTLGEIAGAVKKRLWIVLLAAVALAAIAAVFALFVYDPMFGNYSLTFTLTYPDSAAGKYPDGSPFYYREIVSESALSDAKNSDGRFAEIDIEKLCEKDGIAIAEEKKEGESSSGRYTITVSARYFSDRTAATAFLSALARQSMLRAVQIAKTMNYSLDESAFAGADPESRLELLAVQKQNILAQYDAWIALYSGGYSVAGKTLLNHRAEIDVAFGDVLQNSLMSELETNGYVSLELLPARRAALEAEKAENEKKIEALLGALGSTVSRALALASEELPATPVVQQPADLSETLAALLVRNVEIETRLSLLTEENVRAFEEKLQSVFDAMQEAANKVQAVGYALYEQGSRVYFDTARATQEGTLSPVLAGVVGLVLGFVVASVIVCAAELPKRKKETDQAATPVRP